jgi:hypothetical protein
MGIQERQRDCAANAAVREFGSDFVQAFGLTPRPAAACDVVGSNHVLSTTGVGCALCYAAHQASSRFVTRAAPPEQSL